MRNLDDRTVKLNVKFQGRKFSLEISSNAPINNIFDYVGEVIDIEQLKCTLIIAGKKFVQNEASQTTVGDLIKDGSTIMLVSSATSAIEKIRNFKPDPLVKGFLEEERDEVRRRVRTEQLEYENPWGLKIDQDQEFRFSRFEVLYSRIKPTPFDAEKLLKKLSTDPGIIEIMKSRRFKVGTLCELDPEDADEEQAAKGEADKCLLGWNRNFGERIALRLRTDDFQSFRKYDSIINTLIHELTHNVHGPHDDKFWSLFNELKTQYSKVHGSRKGAKMLGHDMAPVQAKSGCPLSSDTKNGGKLGGDSGASDMDEVRAARLKFLNK